MPPKIVDNTSLSPKDPGPGKRSSRRQAQGEQVDAGQSPSPPTMTTQTQTSGYPVAFQNVPGQVRLPPILPSPTTIATPHSMPLSASTSPFGLEQGAHHFHHGLNTPNNRPAPYNYFSPQERPQPNYGAPISPAGSNPSLRNLQLEPVIPQKRHHGVESLYGRPPPLNIVPPSSILLRDPYSRPVLPPMSAHSSISNASTPSGTTASFPLPGHTLTYSRPPSEASSNSITSRCSLHIRQQPRAARAGPDGKDRRNVDPPPVLQLLLTDFDPDSPTDISELKSNHYVVHCKLISAESPRRDVTTHTTVSEDGSRETSRLLLGTNVASPFFCADDPDVSNMPRHPTTTSTEPDAPPSPSSRFIQSSARSSPPTALRATLPGAFFIFADLSVRRAGSYRLEFTLMRLDPSAMNLPMIHICTSQMFRVVNAKDFDQVHPSTRLVRGLLERGAPFPLKLKKGIREGQRRRTTGDEAGSVEGSVEEERMGGGDEEEEEGEGEGDGQS